MERLVNSLVVLCRCQMGRRHTCLQCYTKKETVLNTCSLVLAGRQSEVHITCPWDSVHRYIFSPGSLQTISLPDFYRYVLKLNSTAPVPNTHGAYTGWDQLLKVKDNILQIYR
jgi:hypothetical protein